MVVEAVMVVVAVISVIVLLVMIISVFIVDVSVLMFFLKIITVGIIIAEATTTIIMGTKIHINFFFRIDSDLK
jgi:hypothetical protein